MLLGFGVAGYRSSGKGKVRYRMIGGNPRLFPASWSGSLQPSPADPYCPTFGPKPYDTINAAGLVRYIADKHSPSFRKRQR